MRSFLFLFLALLWVSSLSADSLPQGKFCLNELLRLQPAGVEEWLGQNEVRYPREVRERNKVIVAVPVYREWNNGHLQRLITYFREQTATPASFELVFIVNNTPEIAAARNSVWRENQETLAYLKTLNAGFAHRVIDGATAGMERNIGAIRDTAIRAALKDVSPERLATTVVGFFDADTEPPKEYIEDLQNAFVSPETVLAISAMDSKIEPGAQREIFETFHALGNAYFDGDLQAAWLGTHPVSGVPRIAVRADHYLRVGGIPHVDWAEDKAFVDRAGANLHDGIRYLWRRPIRTSDRARPDGYDAKNRYNGIYRLGPEAELAQEEERHLPEQLTVQAHLNRLLRDLPDSERELVQSELTYQMAMVSLDQRARSAALREVIERLERAEAIDPKQAPLLPLRDFLISVWFLPWLEKEMGKAKTPDELNKLATQKFPGFFEDPKAKSLDEAQLHAREITLQRVFSLARDYPAKFPGIISYLNEHRALSQESLHLQIVTALRKSPINQDELERLMGLKERKPIPSIPYFQMVTILAYDFEKIEALMKVLNPQPILWTAEDWIIAKNATEVLLEGFQFYVGVLGTYTESQRRSSAAKQVEWLTKIIEESPGPFPEALALILMGSIDSVRAQELHGQLPDRANRDTGIARFRELKRYWDSARFSEVLRVM